MGSAPISVLSPAKVNLVLKVLFRRPDGYHELVSLVDLVSLYDRIRISTQEEDLVVIGDDRGVLPAGEENTIYRAVKLLKERFGVRQGVRIFVEKRIPIGAGLGGGSSDAATVLRELARVWRLPVGKEELMGLGATIGADVPLFIHGGPCVIRGIGERVEPFDLPLLWYVIVYPHVFLSTKEVYGRVRIVLTKGEKEVKFSGKKAGSARNISQILDNDLEEAASTLCSEIRTTKERLIEAGAAGALMSGSGSSVFGLFSTGDDAQKAFQRVADLGSVYIAHSISERGGEPDGHYRREDLPCQ